MAYSVEGMDGVAWNKVGDELTAASETPTGMVIMRMVGDDRDFVFHPGDINELSEDEFCHGCGQIGCGHG